MKIYIHASEVLTGKGVRAKDGRRIKEDDLESIADGAVAVEGSKIIWVGPTSDLPKKYLKSKKTNLKLTQAVMPGLADCHTHLVFAGDRSGEFALRCGGASYQEIAAEGGGIQKTVRETRAASFDELYRLAKMRVESAIRLGVRVLEAKSGYGLDFETEMKLLKVVKKIKSEFKDQIHIESTFLGAHDFPKEISKSDYLKELVERMLPEVAAKKLAVACDVFVDEGYYTLEQAQVVLDRAKALGLKTKVHADELKNTRSAAFAALNQSLSADHLLKIDYEGIKALATSQTVAVLLPTTAFYLKADYAPARKLIDAGACVAIATDFNPGTSMTQNLPFAMTLAALYMGMTKAEIFSAVTYGAVKALGLEKNFGTLEPGQRSGALVLPFTSFEEMYYRFAY